MYTLTEEEIDQIIEEQENKTYDAYVELLQDLERSRLTVDKDAEIDAYWIDYGPDCGIDYVIEEPMY